MIPVTDNGYRMKRAPYWAWIIGLYIFTFLLGAVMGSTNEFTGAWIAITCGRFFVVYTRVKDIGYHGAATLWVLVPFVWIYFGCKNSNTAGKYKPAKLSLEGEDS